MIYGESLKSAEGQPPLSPPITPDEERWWAKERKKFYNRVALRLALPMFLVGVIGVAATKPGRLLFFVPLFAVMSFGMTWVQARFHEAMQKQQEIRWKRIRESLLADSPDEKA